MNGSEWECGTQWVGAAQIPSLRTQMWHNAELCGTDNGCRYPEISMQQNCQGHPQHLHTTVCLGACAGLPLIRPQEASERGTIKSRRAYFSVCTPL